MTNTTVSQSRDQAEVERLLYELRRSSETLTSLAEALTDYQYTDTASFILDFAIGLRQAVSKLSPNDLRHGLASNVVLGPWGEA